MPDVIVNGLFTIAVALLGAFIGFQTHKHYRKDKFNEVVYNEKMMLYKEISKIVSVIDYAAFSSRSLIISPSLREYSSRLFNIIQDNQLILSNKLYSACLNLATLMTEIDVDSKFINKELVDAYSLACNTILNTMRKELGIEAISQDIVTILSTKSRAADLLKSR